MAVFPAALIESSACARQLYMIFSIDSGILEGGGWIDDLSSLLLVAVAIVGIGEGE